jgi:tRNA(Ile)-lysidine synthase
MPAQSQSVVSMAAKRKSMQNTFQLNITHLLRDCAHPKILLAVSGGIDSMAMLQLFAKTDMEIGVAHCNFNLRGEESDHDEGFVREMCLKLDIPCHVKRFDTHDYAHTHKISLQMAARDLRYEWFYHLMRELGYNKIALAHNLDDKVETFFINLVRGTGLQGLKGMKKERDVVIRPLLNITRNEILDFIASEQVPYREDSSNAATKYLRNKIRHEILPKLNEIEPSFLRVMEENMERLSFAWDIYTGYVKQATDKLVVEGNGMIKIDIQALKEQEHQQALSHELFSQFGFGQAVTMEILNCLDHQPGLQFFSPTHRCVKDREYLIITKRRDHNDRKYYIEEGTPEILSPLKMRFEHHVNEGNKVIKDSSIAQLDAEKLTFPLVLRKWQPGDYFYPLGLNGLKKLSDFFTNNKFSLVDKENTWILASGEQIVWIVGHRIDDRFKITPKTENILLVKLF